MDFTKDYSRRDMICFLIPLIMAELFQQIYSLINTVVVNHVLDYSAVAVIGASSGFLSVRGNLISGMMYGFGIYMGKAVGSGEQAYFQKTFSAAFFYTVLIGMIGITVLPFLELIMSAGNVPQELMQDAFWYLFVSFAGCGIIAAKLLLLVTLQAIGETYFFSFLAAAGVVINTVLVVLFIGVWHGGVAFAALAAVLTELMLLFFLFFHIRKKRPDVLRISGLRKISGEIWMDLLKNGCAKTAYFGLVAVGDLFQQSAINTFSIEMIAGQAWAVRLQTILLTPLGELGTASGVITGQNVGAGNKENIRIYHQKLSRMMILFGGISVVFVYLAGFPILRLLSGADKPVEVAAAAVRWLRITVLVFPVCFFILHRNALQAMGKYPQVVWLGVINLAAVFVAANMFVPIFGFEAAAFGVAAGWGLQTIAGVWFFRKAEKGD